MYATKAPVQQFSQPIDWAKELEGKDLKGFTYTPHSGGKLVKGDYEISLPVYNDFWERIILTNRHDQVGWYFSQVRAAINFALWRESQQLQQFNQPVNWVEF
jgi:hypothetical protein